jgi:hypothetical protein
MDEPLGWGDVSVAVVAAYRKHAAAALEVASRYAFTPERVYWEPARDRVALGVRPAASWLLVKQAEGDFLRGPADAIAATQKPLGGPNPLTATIVGGILGSGLGYGGGWLAEQLLPRSAFDRGRLRRTGAALGGLAGAAPGLAWAGTNLANSDRTGGGLRSVLSPWPYTKAAQDSGAFFLPTIPVDAFNRAIWSDVAQAQNPFGTRSPWGDDSQPLQTPAPVAATASGLVAGTAAATGQRRISPLQLGLTAAATAGTGYLAGLAFGKTLGALAGLRPEAQAQLQRLGLWGGLVTGAVNELFGGQ